MNLLDIIKHKPENFSSYLMNISIDEFYQKHTIDNTILHLITLKYPQLIPDIFYSNIIETHYSFCPLYLSKNFFGYTWLHILCQYHMKYFENFNSQNCQ